MITGEEIVAKAREYLGTPFVDQGRKKGIGIDCAGLPACVADELGLNGNGFRSYRRQTSFQVIDRELRKAMRPIHPPENYHVGNLVVIRSLIMRNLYHLAIWTGSGLIHAKDKAARDRTGNVVEVSVDREWVNSRLMGSYAFVGGGE